MGKLGNTFVVLLAFVAFQLYQNFNSGNAAKELHLEVFEWFGKGEKKPDREEIVQFKVDVPDAVIKDLRDRLERTKLPLPLEDVDDFEYGFNPKYLHTVVEYWKNSYDWKKWEAVLNEFPQYTTEIEGLKLHFLRVKPPADKYKTIVPLLITHGWPGNVFEFYKIIPMLTDPEKNLKISTPFAFEVIAPSIPGYGWSSSPYKKGFNQWATARIFRKLMLRLGFEKFFLQGGDWGSIVARNVALYYPENVLGVHVNFLPLMPHSNLKAGILTVLGMILPSTLLFSHPGTFAYGWEPFKDLVFIESGYMHIQATKPDTVGIGLTDSPAGLAAYILEKFSTGTDRRNRKLPDGNLTGKFTLDELLTIVTIYWINGNMANSQRYYKEYFISPHLTETQRAYLSVPTGFAAFPNEMLYGAQPKELLQTAVNLTRYTEMMRGGHFAALEEPKLLAKDIFNFVQDLM